jgi:hypothetical protein
MLGAMSSSTREAQPAAPAAIRRATSIPDLQARLARFRSADSMQRALAFQPRPTDVFIVTYPKCGTTWMQQIVHGLRTGGDMSFGEISEVVPWLESALDMGIDVDRPQRAEPRAFKTHLTWDEIPKGGRYIYVARDPRDALVSFYHFFEGWMFEPGSISLDVFAREMFVQGTKSGRYWDHVRGYWPLRHEPHVLMLCFEDMQHDLAATVQRVATFLGLPADPAHLAVATEQASFAFMKAHERKFDDHLLRATVDPLLGLPPGGTTTKVRAGRAGDHARVLVPALVAELDAIWQDELAGPLGLASYEHLRAALRASA